MSISDERLRELAEKMAAVVNGERGKPSLRLVELPARPARDIGMDAIQREAHYRRVRYLASAYKLQWLVDQATWNCANIEDLSDDELIELHADMDKARECPDLDISYEEMGLVRSRA
jgi:hypothetical protein